MTERTDPMYQEFDDADLSRWPYVSSAKAGAEMRRLAGLHGLGFIFNPGGGQFTCIDERYPLYGFNCQISTCDDVMDLNTLRTAIGDAAPPDLPKKSRPPLDQDTLDRLDDAAARAIFITNPQAWWKTAPVGFSDLPESVLADLRSEGRAARKALLAELDFCGFDVARR